MKRIEKFYFEEIRTRIIVEREYLPCTMRQRFIHKIIDDLIIMFVAAIIFCFFKEYKQLCFTLMTVSYFMYFIVFEYVTGRTIGKNVTKSLVLDSKTNKKPYLIQLLIRALSRSVVIDAITYIFSDRPIGMHDYLSGTYVSSFPYKKVGDVYRT